MKALILTEYHRLEYGEMPEPQVGPGEVLLQVKACGICGSDIHGIDGSTGRRIPPIVMGHEACGEIVKLGEGVKGYAIGDKVTFDSTIYCGKCHYCRRGQINLCNNRRVLGVSCTEYRQHGAFAEYVAVPQHILYPIPAGLSFERAAMVEPLSIAFHAVRRTPLVLDDAVVVVGAGTIGLLLIQSLRAAGCGLIVAVDVEQHKLDLALQLGADHAFDAGRTDVPEEVLHLTERRGAEAAFEAVGLDSTFKTALGCLKKGGSLTLIGNIASSIDMALQSVVTREITLYGCCASSGEYPACLNMMARGTINVDVLISAVAPLSEGAHWFKRLYNKEKGLFKVILKP